MFFFQNKISNNQLDLLSEGGLRAWQHSRETCEVKMGSEAYSNLRACVKNNTEDGLDDATIQWGGGGDYDKRLFRQVEQV